jgi:hypothetical protein
MPPEAGDAPEAGHTPGLPHRSQTRDQEPCVCSTGLVLFWVGFSRLLIKGRITDA